MQTATLNDRVSGIVPMVAAEQVAIAVYENGTVATWGANGMCITGFGSIRLYRFRTCEPFSQSNWYSDLIEIR